LKRLAGHSVCRFHAPYFKVGVPYFRPEARRWMVNKVKRYAVKIQVARLMVVLPGEVGLK
jgi:hypothetical protein